MLNNDMESMTLQIAWSSVYQTVWDVLFMNQLLLTNHNHMTSMQLANMTEQEPSMGM